MDDQRISESSKLHITISSSDAFQASPDVVDVIIVGAGLSGLRAAVDICKAGLSCLVLEATDRIGGKVLSLPNQPNSEYTVDLGPAWINDTSQSHMWALGKRYSMAFEEQYTLGHDLVQMPDGSVVKGGLEEMPFPPKDLKIVNEFFGNVIATGVAIEGESYEGPVSTSLDKITFQQWIDKGTENSQAVTWMMDCLCQAIVGARGDEFSALYMLRYFQSSGGIMPLIGMGKGTAQYLRPQTGCKAFTDGLTSNLPKDTIHLNEPVLEIQQSSSKNLCHTTTPSKTYLSKKVIISIPSPLYPTITFSPPLPTPKQDISATKTKLGYYTKVILTYLTPWWRAHDLSGQILSNNGPIILTADTSVPCQSQFSLSTFILGPQGREWSKQPYQDRMNAVTDHLRFLFGSVIGPENVPKPLNMIEKDWAKDEWFCGAPSTLYRPGVLREGGFEVMAERFGDLHFVGTETSEEFEGYMEGAVRSGERGAREVIEALR